MSRRKSASVVSSEKSPQVSKTDREDETDWKLKNQKMFSQHQDLLLEIKNNRTET